MKATTKEFGRLRAVAAVRRRLRELLAEGTGLSRDGRCVLACSGGADSAALVLSAAGMPRSGERFVVAHVRHDLRPAGVTAADLEAARGLAVAYGMGFESAEVAVERSGSVEAAARAARYRALGQIAKRVRAGFVATGHHAEDQAETVLMRLLRGAGPDGLAGMRESRPLQAGGGAPVLLRPMLGIRRAECERVCREAGFAWREDETNRDESLLRNAVRRRVLPALEEVEADAAERIAATAAACAAAGEPIGDIIENVYSGADAVAEAGALAWDRESLRTERAWIVGGVLRRAADELTGSGGADGRGLAALRPVLKAVSDTSTEPRVFELPGVRVEVTARRVVVRKG